MPPYCLRNLNDELGVEFRVLILASNSIDRIATRIAQYPVLTASDFRTDLAAASWERGDPVVNLVFECQA
jgi:hypothetical protein